MGGPLLVRLEECRVALAKEYAGLVMVQTYQDQKVGKKARRASG
jgi:hypothetical protein